MPNCSCHVHAVTLLWSSLKDLRLRHVPERLAGSRQLWPAKCLRLLDLVVLAHVQPQSGKVNVVLEVLVETAGGKKGSMMLAPRPSQMGKSGRRQKTE